MIKEPSKQDLEMVDEMFCHPKEYATAQAWIETIPWGVGSMMLREKAISRYGFSIPCAEAIEALVALSPLLEIGAGSGYWARLLREAGADVIAVDNQSGKYLNGEWSSEGVELMDHVQALETYPGRNVLMSWPDYENDTAYHVVSSLPAGAAFAYIGEGNGGCTADEKFHRFVEVELEPPERIEIPQWDGIHDRLEIYRR